MNRRLASAVLPLLGVALAALLLASLRIGVYGVSTERIVEILARGLSGSSVVASDPQTLVILLVRLPRVLLAALAGAALGLSGAVLQGLLRNPLVGPDIVGVSGGAACGGVIAILLGWPDLGIVTLALVGGVLAISTAAALARLVPTGTLGIVLSGVVVGSFCAAVLGLLEYLADPNEGLPQIIYWLLGSFAGADRSKVSIMASALAVSGSLLIALRWRINLLSLGDTDAAGLGVRVKHLRWLLIGLVAWLIAAQVSVSGIVGWVGLLVPHIARMIVGPDHNRLVPTAALLGAIFVLAVDDVARSAASQELPIGLITALLGTPVFFLILSGRRSSGWRGD